MNIYSVYWIHYPHQTDFLTEGYVGISKDVKRREAEHRRGKNLRLRRALAKGAQLTILASELSLQEAADIELAHRPHAIGWNLTKGGGIPPSHSGRTRSIEARKNVSDSLTGRVFTAEHRSNISKAKRNQPAHQNWRSAQDDGRRKKFPKLDSAAKQWLIEFPDGTVLEISNLAEFCRTHGLQQPNMSRVAQGLAKQHKGFKASQL